MKIIFKILGEQAVSIKGLPKNMSEDEITN